MSEMGFYGKLPIFPDFITSEDLSGSADALKVWFDTSVQRMMQQLADQIERRWADLPPLQMVVRPEEAEAAMAAVALPSQDASGRRFPFLVFAEVSAGIYRDCFSAVCEAYRLFLEVGRKAVQDSGNAFGFERQRNTIWALREGLPRSAHEAVARCRAYSEQYTLRELCEVLDQSEEGRGKRTIDRAFIALAPMHGDEQPDMSATFRFPLSGDRARHGFEICFWVRMTETLMGRKLTDQPLLWTDRQLDIAFTAPGDLLVPRAWLADTQDDSLWEFSGMELDSSMVDEKLYRGFEELVADSDQNLAGFLLGLEKLTT